jgi:hypothetical protein
MFKSIRHVLLIVLLMVAASGREVSAIGFGAYLSGQRGSGDWEIEEQAFPFTLIKADGDLRHFGIGFVLDTAPAQDRLFSYRLNVGLEEFNADLDDLGDALKLGGVSVNNTFGFQIFRSADVRLWAGPHVVTGFYGGALKELDFVDVALVEFGAGGSFGADFAAGERLSFSIVTGFTFSGFGGKIEFFTGDDDLRGNGGSAFVNLSLIWSRQGRTRPHPG